MKLLSIYKPSQHLQERLAEYEFKLPFLYPVGLWITENIILKYFTPYKRDLRNKIFNLYGQKYLDEYMKLHIIQQVVLVAAVLLCTLLLELLNTGDSVFVFGILLSILSWYWVDKNLDSKLARRKQNILIDLPGFINKLTLLVSAGLNFNRAVQKILTDNNQQGVLYRELNKVLTEINTGASTSRAYEDFALRCGIPEITRFVSTVLQNMNRGGNDLVYVLKILAQDSWEKRKDVARRQGEEASSKLVFPMVMIFLVVAMIVLAPAMMAMGQ